MARKRTSQKTAKSAPQPAPANARLKVDVEWASIDRATGELFVVGHYIGVLPQNAEGTLDRALSGAGDKVDDSQLVLTDLTRRGAIRGALGDIIFFPWKGRGQIVLAGMGRLGTFKEPQLRVLGASLTRTVGRLWPKATICTVLIGAGFGNMKVAEAVAGLLDGVAQALAADPNIDSLTLRIVEFRLDRAYEILECVRKVAKKAAGEANIEIETSADVIARDDGGGKIPIPFGFSLMMASLAQACHQESGPLLSSVDQLVEELPKGLRVGVRESLKRLGAQTNRRQLGLAFRMGADDGAQATTIADRISFAHDGTRIQAAAITNLTTVGARTLEVGSTWLDRIVETLRAPSEDVYQTRGRSALRSLVHSDLREKLLGNNPLVLELDRTMARVPWELIHDGDQPLAIRRPVARQLRTSYSPRPSDVARRPTWRALVIGDPDGSLPQAVEEARLVAAVLKAQGLEADLRIGPPDALGLGAGIGVDPADLYEVLELLQAGEYDIVHFAGHAAFDPQYPDRSGWYFKDDVLTASKLEGVERMPRLIVANACVSAELSNLRAARPPAAGAPPVTVVTNDSGVVASLADEFFRRGVADYIGTAWEVRDLPARDFAEAFYAEFLADWKNSKSQRQLGVAVQKARASLFAAAGSRPSDWAAYQHYGDPTRTLADYRM